jgi:hypothetical protein
MPALTADQITLSHTIDDMETMRGTVLRESRQIDRIIPDLQHAIEHGHISAAVSLLATIERLNNAVITTARPA